MEQIRLDLIPGKSAPVCHASQYDVGRTIRLNLVEGGSEYSIPSGTTAEIHIRKPDNNIISAAVTVTQGNKYIDIVTAEQWTACAGTNLCEIVLTNGGNVIGTINFILEVEMDPIDGGSASESVIYNIQALVDTALATSSLVNLPIHLVEGTTTDADLAQALRDAFANNQDVLGYASISGTTTAIYCRSTSASTDAFMAIHYLLTGVLDDKVYTFEVVVGASGDQIDVSKTVEEKGKFTIHIVESTMTESAADILAALSDGKELQVIYKPDANSLTTHVLPLTLDSGARPDGIRALDFASFWGSKLYAADIVLDSLHSTVASLRTTNGKDLGDFPIHIHNSTITETAGEVLDAMADGLKPYVIWTNNSQSNYTFTYVLSAVWNPDATTETLIFGCPITGTVRTIHVFINPTTRTYSSSIQIVDYTIPQIDDSSTSSNKVWSAQKTNSELAGKAEIDDTAVSSSTAWSSSQIASLLPTESASGAVANFETPLTLPLVAHIVTIEPVQAGTGDPSPSNPRPISGWSAVTISHSGADTSEAKEIEIPLGQTVYGGTLDVTSGVLKVTYAEVNMGSLGWNYDNINGKFFTIISDMVNSSDYGRPSPFLCSCYKVITQSGQGSSVEDNSIYLQYNVNKKIWCKDTNYTSANDFINSVNGQTIVYELATPVEITLTPEQINTLKGVNNIWADTGDTSVEYKQDIQTYIDNRLSSGTRSLSLAKAPVETEETKQEEQEGEEPSER